MRGRQCPDRVFHPVLMISRQISNPRHRRRDSNPPQGSNPLLGYRINHRAFPASSWIPRQSSAGNVASLVVIRVASAVKGARSAGGGPAGSGGV